MKYPKSYIQGLFKNIANQKYIANICIAITTQERAYHYKLNLRTPS